MSFESVIKTLLSLPQREKKLLCLNKQSKWLLFFKENKRGSPYCDFIRNNQLYKWKERTIGIRNSKVTKNTNDWKTSMMKYWKIRWVWPWAATISILELEKLCIFPNLGGCCQRPIHSDISKLISTSESKFLMLSGYEVVSLSVLLPFESISLWKVISQLNSNN